MPQYPTQTAETADPCDEHDSSKFPCSGLDQDCSRSPRIRFQLRDDPAATDEEECPICFEACDCAVRLPCCKSWFCRRCINDHQSLTVGAGSSACPMCRAPIPSRDVLFKEAARRYFALKQCIDRGDTSWDEHKPEMQTVQQLLEQAADLGDANALFNLGTLYLEGHGVLRDFEVAKEYFEQAALLGDLGAVCNLGFMHEKGFGTNQDVEKASELYAEAADGGHAPALYNLGVLRLSEGEEGNITLAITLFQKSMEKGDLDAMFQLAVLYEQGHGVSSNLRWSKQLYGRAAKLGHPGARFRLAVMSELQAKYHNRLFGAAATCKVQHAKKEARTQ